MEYLRDKWDEQCVKQLRKDIVKSNKNYSFYSPCENCLGRRCASCDFRASLALLKELCSEDYCKFCWGRLKCNDGSISCGVHCDGDDENYFACFDPDYLAILDAICGE